MLPIDMLYKSATPMQMPWETAARYKKINGIYFLRLDG